MKQNEPYQHQSQSVILRQERNRKIAAYYRQRTAEKIKGGAIIEEIQSGATGVSVPLSRYHIYKIIRETSE
jgi:hypothetical protein